MWKADLERDEKGVGDGREDCTSTGLAAGRPSQLLGIGLFHGRLKRSGNVGSSTRRGMVQAGPLLRAWLFRILLIRLS